MNIYDTTAYFMTVVAITLAPGPVVLMLMVRAASNDTLGALGFGIGFALGGVLIIAAVCLGMGAWLEMAPQFFAYGKYIMLAYLLWLAKGIWQGGFDMAGDCDVKRRGMMPAVAAGATTCFVSPYMVILFPLVLPGMVDISAVQGGTFAMVSLVTFVALSAGAGIIIGFSSQLRRLVRNPAHVVTVNRTLAGLLVGAGGWMAFG